jgi:ribose transport system substrate-binding protein
MAGSMRGKLGRWVMSGVAGLGLMASVIAGVGSTPIASAASGTGCANPYGFHDPKAVIGVSYAFLGNSWRRTMQNDLTKAINQALACHEIGGVDYTYAGNSTTEQISQIDDLILKHVSVILVDASSSTGLNAVIAKATRAGIPVVNFDTPVTSPDAYVLNWNFVDFGRLLAQYVANRLHGHGNVLLVRGLAGTSIDQGEYAGWMSVLHHYPKIKVVGTVYGNWDEATAESAVAGLLPSLPKVDAVLVNGGGYGVLSAFQAAHRPLPLVVGGNRGAFLQWWWAHRKTYQTFSYSTFPETGVLAFYVAQFLLKGTHVAHRLWLEPLVITAKDLPAYKNTPASAVADAHFTVEWVYQHLIK